MLFATSMLQAASGESTDAGATDVDADLCSAAERLTRQLLLCQIIKLYYIVNLVDKPSSASGPCLLSSPPPTVSFSWQPLFAQQDRDFGA